MIAKVIHHLRVRPFLDDSEEGRAAERYRLALWTVIANFASRFIGLLVLMLSVSWTVPYLGPERFGAWMAIASLAGMLSFLDLGLGNALTNRVTQVASLNNVESLKRSVSGGLGLLAFVSVAISALLFIVASVLPWEKLLNLESQELLTEVKQTALAFSVLFGLITFASGVSKVFNGLQRGFEVHVAGILGSLAGLISLAYAVKIEAGLPLLLFCTLGGPLLGNLLLLLPLARRGTLERHDLMNSIRRETPNLFNVGSLFLLLQVGTMVGWGADSLIIANATGTVSVASYAVIQRLTMLISQPLSIINAPLWNAYADAHARGENNFIRKTFRKSFLFTLIVSSLGAVLLILFGQDLVSIWTKGKIEADMILLSLLAVWLLLESTGNSLGVLLNGLGVINQQVWVVSAFVAVAVPLKFFLADVYGASGVVAAGILAYFITTVVGYGVIYRKDLVEKLR